jgi:hypothetical protein
MRYKLIADVEGEVHISSPVVIEIEDYQTEFQINEEGKLSKVAISLSVPEEKLEKFRGSVILGEVDSTPKIEISTDMELHNRLVDRLQMLESALAFSTQAALTRIDCATPDQEYFPESPQEQELIAVTSFSYARQYQATRVILHPQDLYTIVESAPKYDELRVPKGFWREGMISFSSFEYVQAFYYFFFVIEDFYAPGRSGKKPFLDAVSKSGEFRDLCANSLEAFSKLERHNRNLQEFLDEFGYERTIEGLQELLFEIRGSLHHYSSRTPRPKGTPFNPNDFETIALLSLHIVTAAIAYKIVEINNRTDQG